MRKQSRVILAAGTVGALLIILLLTLYAGQMLIQTSESNEPDEKTKVTILTSDSLHDQSWGSLAYQAQLYIEDQYDVETALYPNISTSTLMDFRIEHEAENYADLLIGHGREFSESFTAYAAKYPDISFVTLHGDTHHKNHSVFTFSMTDAEIMAIAAAAEKSETKRIGVLTKTGDWSARQEIEQAIDTYNLEVEILEEEIDTRNDKETALSAMDRLTAQDADVIYPRGNTFNRYVIEQAKKEDIHIIGFMEDQAYMAEEHVLTSVISDIPMIYDRILAAYLSPEGLPEGVNILDISDGIYGLAPLGPMFTEEEQHRLEHKFEEIAAD